MAKIFIVEGKTNLQIDQLEINSIDDFKNYADTYEAEFVSLLDNDIIMFPGRFAFDVHAWRRNKLRSIAKKDKAKANDIAAILFPGKELDRLIDDILKEEDEPMFLDSACKLTN